MSKIDFCLTPSQPKVLQGHLIWLWSTSTWYFLPWYGIVGIIYLIKYFAQQWGRQKVIPLLWSARARERCVMTLFLWFQKWCADQVSKEEISILHLSSNLSCVWYVILTLTLFCFGDEYFNLSSNRYNRYVEGLSVNTLLLSEYVGAGGGIS